MKTVVDLRVLESGTLPINVDLLRPTDLQISEFATKLTELIPHFAKLYREMDANVRLSNRIRQLGTCTGFTNTLSLYEIL